MEEYRGAKLTIRYCEQPPADSEGELWMPPSLREALGSIQAGKHATCMSQLAARRERLANTGRLRSPDHWNTEARLPNGSRFYAIKVGKLRAYGWFSTRYKGVFYISHFAFKKGQKLSSQDEQRVIKNWRRIEEQNP